MIIVLIILLIILLLLIIPLGIRVHYDGGFAQLKLSIRVGFFDIPLPLGSKKVQKKAVKEAKKVEKATEEEVKKELPKILRDKDGSKKSPLEVYRTIEPILSRIPEIMYRVIAAIKFRDIYIVWYAKGKDAAAAAITVGRYYAIFNSAVATLTPPFDFGFKKVEFLPNYTGDERFQGEVRAVVTTSILPLLITAVWFLGEMNSERQKRPKKRRNTPQKRKEQKAS